MPRCAGCKQDLGRENFSCNQLRKVERRCRTCTGAASDSATTTSPGASTSPVSSPEPSWSSGLSPGSPVALGSDPEPTAAAWAVGTAVAIAGLKARPDLNGRRGRVLGTDGATGRIMVGLGSEAVKVKAENLQRVPDAKASATSDKWYGAATAEDPTEALRFVIESARLRVEDEYVQCGDAVGSYAEGAGEFGEASRWLRRYVRAAQARGVLPAWWTDATTAALFRLADSTATVTLNGKQHGFCIRHAVEAHDVAAVWGPGGVAQLRKLAASVLGPVHEPFGDSFHGGESDDDSDLHDDEDSGDEDYSDDYEDFEDSALRQAQFQQAMAAQQVSLSESAARWKVERAREAEVAAACEQRFASGESNRRLSAGTQARECLSRVAGLRVCPAAGAPKGLESADGRSAVSLDRFIQDSALSRFLMADSSAEVDPNTVDLNCVKSLVLSGRGDSGLDIVLSDFHAEKVFPNLESFSYAVEDGYGQTFDLRGLSNPLWAKTLRALKLDLGPCHISEGSHGLEVLAPLVNLEVFEVSHFRHADITDLKVAEHFKSLTHFSWKGSVDSGAGGGDDLSDSAGEEGKVRGPASLDLSSHLKLRRLEISGDDVCFCAVDEQRGIRLHLPNIGGPGANTPDTPRCHVRIIHGDSEWGQVISLRLRRTIQGSATYQLEELVEKRSYEANRCRVTLEPKLGREMDELWRKVRRRTLKSEEEDHQRGVDRERHTREAIMGLYVNCESTRAALHRYFPPAMVYSLRNPEEVQRWVEWDQGLQCLRESVLGQRRFAPGDRCFLLELMENKYGRPDHAGFWSFSRGSSLCGSVSWGSGAESNMSVVMQHKRKGAQGIFMVECVVKKARAASRVKLERTQHELSAPDFHAQPHTGPSREEYEYLVEIVNAGDPEDSSGESLEVLTAFAHESFLFTHVPLGWTRKVEIFQSGYRSSQKMRRFNALLPPEGVLKTGPSRQQRER